MTGAVIRKRRVFHVPGYDPAPPAAVKRRFTRELQRFEETWSVEASVSAIGSDDQAWRVTARGPNWQVETDYRLVAWDDVIHAAAQEPVWRRIPTGACRFRSISPLPPCRAICAPIGAMPAFSSTPSSCSPCLWWLRYSPALLWRRSAAIPWQASLQPSLLSFFLWQWPGRRLFLHLLFDDWIFSRRYVRADGQALEAKLDLRRAKSCKPHAIPQTQEVVVIGHSLGAVLAIDMLDRALRLEPALARHRRARCSRFPSALRS